MLKVFKALLKKKIADLVYGVTQKNIKSQKQKVIIKVFIKKKNNKQK